MLTLLEFLDKMVGHLFEFGAIDGEELLKGLDLLEEILGNRVDRAWDDQLASRGQTHGTYLCGIRGVWDQFRPWCREARE